jgi:hypothetical protein
MSIIKGIRRPNRSPSHPSDSDAEGDLLDGSPEIMSDRAQNKGEKKEIERIKRPPEETSDESIALNAAQRFEQTQRFHR